MNARWAWSVALLCLLAVSTSAGPQVRDVSSGPLVQTSSVKGTVVTHASPSQALDRVLVSVTVVPTKSPGIMTRSAITDEHGRFVIENLPSGVLSIDAVKRGYVPASYGALRAGRPGVKVPLAEGEVVEAQVEMTPGSVISGIVRDARGQPIPAARVWAFDAANVPYGTLSNSAGMRIIGGSIDFYPSVATNDRGEYRIYDLAPARYVVLSQLPQPGFAPTAAIESMDDARIDAIFEWLRRRTSPGGLASGPATVPPPAPSASTEGRVVLAPIYAPGTPVLSEATVVVLGPGDQRDGIDLTLAPVPVSTVEGTVASDGSPGRGTDVFLVPDSPGFSMSAVPQLTHPIDADGRFAFGGVLPGHYHFFARTPAGQAAVSAADLRFAATDLDVDGTDVVLPSLPLRPGGHLTGHIVFDGDTPQDLTTVEVELAPNAAANNSPVHRRYATRAAADGAFDLPNVAPGSYALSAHASPADGHTWWCLSAPAKGRDALDDGIVVSLDQEPATVTVTLTDRPIGVRGRLQHPDSRAASEYYVVLFGADSSFWHADSRRLKVTRPLSDGTFSLSDVPPGAYVVAALSDYDPADPKDPGFFPQLAANGVRVTVTTGETSGIVLQVMDVR